MLPPRQVLRTKPPRWLGATSALVSSATAQFTSDLQARVNTQSASVQATIYNQTGVDTSNARVQQGASAAMSLAKNGYDPHSTSDNATLVQAIAGGLALIPGAQPAAAAVEALWLVGNQIACPVTDAFASIGMGTACGAPPCKSGGNWTVAGLLQSNAQGLPAMPQGSFASVVVPALAMYAVQAANCNGGVPPDVIVDAVVAMWNQTHAGPAVGYFIPPIATLPSSGGVGSITPDLLVVGQGGGSTPAGRAGKDPNAYYGFGPVSQIISDGYQESNSPADVNSPQPWSPFYVAPAPSGLVATTPRIVSLNSGELLQTQAEKTLRTVASHSAAFISGGVISGLVYGWISGKAFDAVLGSRGRKLWVCLEAERRSSRKD